MGRSAQARRRICVSGRLHFCMNNHDLQVHIEAETNRRSSQVSRKAPNLGGLDCQKREETK